VDENHDVGQGGIQHRQHLRIGRGRAG